MIAVTPGGETLGATVEGADAARPLAEGEFRAILLALGRHGVLRFPAQHLDAAQLKELAARFGALEVNVAGAFQESGLRSRRETRPQDDSERC